MNGQVSDKPKLVIMSSWGARGDPSSPLLRFVRDYAGILKRFDIHTTGGTGHSILASGLYKDEITCHHSGPEGGVVELAAMVARREAGTVIFLSDPLDLRSDVPENFALQRVCREIGVRLIDTLASAEEWALCGGDTTTPDPSLVVTPSNWNPDGHKNVDEKGEPRFLSIPEQTIALIAHDKKKEEMVDFVNEHLDFLSKFHRILTTGTTGWLLKLLYADDTQRKDIELEANAKLGVSRFIELKEMLWFIRLLYADDSKRSLLEKEAQAELGEERYRELMKTLKKRIKEKKGENKSWPKLKNSNSQFVNGVMPLPSGPKGGDILISDEILKNQCHRIIFFHDPGTAHPHEPDIRLLERTCQIRGVYAVCVSDRNSAHNSFHGLKKCIGRDLNLKPCISRQLCQKYKLREAVIVNTDDDADGPALGSALARACAGYFFRWLMVTLKEKEVIRVGIAHGWATKQVLDELKEMEKSRLLQKPLTLSEKVIWSPLIGNITVEWREQEAVVIANDFKEYFGGKIEAFQSNGLGRIGSETILPVSDNMLIDALEKADIVLVPGAPWDDQATLYKKTALNPEYFPKFSDAVGLISAVFLDKEGKEVRGQYSMVGLGYSGFRQAAKNAAVLLMCGGEKRRSIALAALRGRLVSVLITSSGTADWLLKQNV